MTEASGATSGLDPTGTAPRAWPGGATGALVVNVMYEQWDPGVAPGLGPMGNPLPEGALDHQAVGWADYGWRTGVGAVLRLLARERVHATFYVSGVLTETAPATVEAVVAGGHELAGHAWAQNRVPAVRGRQAETDDVQRCTEALQRVGGQRPRGWVSPRCTPSEHTAEILAGAGYDWFGDVFDADLPYPLHTPAGRITALPFGLEVNDLPMLVRYGRPTSDLVVAFDHLARSVSQGEGPAYVDVTVHAHVGCRPAGLLALADVIASARRHGMCTATRAEVVDRLAPAGPGGQPPT